MQLSNAYIHESVTVKLHTLNMNITQPKHMHLIYKLSTSRWTTYIPWIQDKDMAYFTKQA